MDILETIRNELDQAAEVLAQFKNDPDQLQKIDSAAELLASSLKQDGKILSCGNGGSHCDAMHFAEELSGIFRDDRKPLPALSISDPSYITCVANDLGFEQVFSRAVAGHGRSGDSLLAISTSGNSINVINAVKTANDIGMNTIVLSGKSGGKLLGLGDVEIIVPHNGYADRIQEVHIKIIHILILLIEKKVI